MNKIRSDAYSVRNNLGNNAISKSRHYIIMTTLKWCWMKQQKTKFPRTKSSSGFLGLFGNLRRQNFAKLKSWQKCSNPHKNAWNFILRLLSRFSLQIVWKWALLLMIFDATWWNLEGGIKTQISFKDCESAFYYHHRRGPLIWIGIM